MMTAQPPSLAGFFAHTRFAFDRAAQTHAPDRRLLQVARQHVALWLASPALHPMLMPALAHLEDVDTPREPDISFSLWDTTDTGVNPPPPPFTAADYHRYGQRALHL